MASSFTIDNKPHKVETLGTLLEEARHILNNMMGIIRDDLRTAESENIIAEDIRKLMVGVQRLRDKLTKLNNPADYYIDPEQLICFLDKIETSNLRNLRIIESLFAEFKAMIINVEPWA